MKRVISALVAGFVASPMALQAQVPAPLALEPTSKWSVEYAEWKCLLHREFSTQGKRTLMSLSREPLTTTAWMKVATQGSFDRRDDGKATLFLDGKRVAETLHFNIYPASGFQMREFMLDIIRHPLKQTSEHMRFEPERYGVVDLHVSDFPAAWRALNNCMSDLSAKLGIDEAQVAQMAVEPEGWSFSFVDLPHRAPLEFAVLYWVAENGRVDDCRLLQPSGQARFDAAYCDRLKAKARFKPARDAAGKPIRVPRFENNRLRVSQSISTTPGNQ